jgi:hypothetical protein
MGADHVGRRRLPIFAALLFWGSFGLADEGPASPVEKEESWQVIMLSGQRIGYARSLVEPFEDDGELLVRALVEMHMTIKRFGQTLRMATSLQTVETPDGKLRRFTFEMSNPPATPTKTLGVVDGDRLSLESEVAGRKTKTEKPWDLDVKSPAYQDRVLREKSLRPGESLSFKAFLPEFSKVATIKLVAEKDEEITLLDGATADALRVRITQSIVPGMATIGWMNAKGESLKSSTSMLGSEMETYTVSRDEALKEIDAKELDLAVNTLIKVKPLPGVHDREEITYRIRIPDQDPTEFLARGDVQSVQRVDAHTADVTIRAVPIPDKSEPSPSPGPEYLASSEFLQSDDPKVKEHAEAAAKDLADSAQIARAMEKYVRDKLNKKNFSTALASAAEVAEKLEGDCTEHAVLLAAMLRAKGIPSRVAVGIVYVELNRQPSFGGHMWTEAWLNGKWVPLDATMGRGGTRAGHIKLGDASFADDNATPIGTFAPLMLAIGRMQIEPIE